MLRLRTEFSFGRAIGTINEALNAYTMGSGYKYVPLTDNASAWGWPAFEAECKQRRLNPVYGAEIDVVPTLRGPEVRTPELWEHWLIFAQGGDAAPVNRVVNRILARRKPRKVLTYKEVFDQFDEDDLFIVIGGNEGRFDAVALGEAWEGRQALRSFLYAQLTTKVDWNYIERIKALSIPFAACGHNDMATPDQADLFRISFPDSDIREPDAIKSSPDLLDRLNAKFRQVASVADALANSRKVLEAAAGARPRPAMLPLHPCQKVFETLVRNGAKQRHVDLSDRRYSDRLAYELEVITGKGLHNYFLIIADFCKWAKNRALLGPGRGSSAASLVCYALGITNVDPIAYGLMFERFLNPDRADPADIDVDIQHDRREEVFDYLIEQYGNAAHLGAISTWGKASAFTQAAKACGVSKLLTDLIDPRKIEGISLLKWMESDRNARQLIHDHPKMRFAGHLEGRARHTTTHAAGVIVNFSPLEDIAPVEIGTIQRTKDNTDALKLDILGVRALTTIAETMDACQLGPDFVSRINVNLNDQAAFKILNSGRYAGIYQYGAAVNRELARQVYVRRFEDLVALGSLARPGPLASGQTALWVERHKNQSMMNQEGDPNSKLRKIIAPTLGVIIYQEQVMEIAKAIGGLSWADVHRMRKQMAAADSSDLSEFRERFISGAVVNGNYTKQQASTLWRIMAAHGGYSFCRAHAVAYAMLTYWCLWLKSRFPREFAAAYLNNQQQRARRLEMLAEIKRGKFANIVPFDADRSTLKWQVIGEGSDFKLIGPLTNAQKIGPKLANTILGARARGERLDEKTLKKVQAAESIIG